MILKKLLICFPKEVVIVSDFLRYELDNFCDGYNYFGAHFDGDGVIFRVYAPNAYQVSVAGDFNDWNYKEYIMQEIDDTGIHYIRIPKLPQWTLYKFGIYTSKNKFQEKCDPYGFFHELRPNHASKVVDIYSYEFKDEQWMNSRSLNYDKPMNIYEIHAGSWIKEVNNYLELAHTLVDYLNKMGYSHVELMPITEYPFDGSWGYQVTGFFSVTSRYGSLDQFKEMVDIFHQNGIGVILDVVPVHFVKDDHGLRKFDGTCLYEEQTESQWGTLFFDYNKKSVQNFFMSSIAYFTDICHIDGVRMDAVSNLIFYHGNKELGVNESGINFLKMMNQKLKYHFPNLMLIAEDSSDYANVTKRVEEGGLGFDYKWDLGWMNDTLKYYSLNPLKKKHFHHQLTFSMAYFYSERFILPLSHDEVVHGKKAIIDKMWGEYEDKFALVKNLYVYMMTHPGKKLNFMGNEFAHFREWDEKIELDWFLLKYPRHDSFKRFICDLNQIYKHHIEFSKEDYNYDCFKWLDVNNANQSIYSFYRIVGDEVIVVVLNMTSVSYEHYDIAVPHSGRYMELLNSEKDIYDGCNMCNYYIIESESATILGYGNRLKITLAPYAAIIFKKC